MDNVGWIDALGKDLRCDGRRLRRSPGFTLVANLKLALGIDANIAAFTVRFPRLRSCDEECK
jgi:hypothetical protein